ncbi:hypothetical protein ABPG72_009089 [Tetrahymena utriculariae]
MGQTKKNKNQKLSQNYYQKMCPNRELPIKEFETDYAIIEKNLGQLHYAVACSDGKVRLAVLRGRLRYKVYVNEGDIVLVGLRDYQDNKCDIILKYHKEEIRQLWQLKEISNDFYLKTRQIFPFKCGSDANTISCVNDSDIVFLNDDEIEDLKSRSTLMISQMESNTNQSFSLIQGQESLNTSGFENFTLNSDLDIRSERSESTQVSDFEVLDI